MAVRGSEEADEADEGKETPPERVGLLTIEYDSQQCEILTLDALVESQGIGTMLLDSLEELADVQKAYTNADFPPEILAQYQAAG